MDSTAKIDPKATMDSVRENLTEAGRKVWLAGLGVVATVEDQGRKMWGDLVEKGKAFETKEPTSVIGKFVDQAADQMKSMRGSLESGITDASRVVLHRMGLPTHDEMQSLIARVEQLTAKVEALGKKEAR